MVDDQTEQLPVAAEQPAVQTQKAEAEPDSLAQVLKKRDLKFELKKAFGANVSKDESLCEQKLQRRTSLDVYESQRRSQNLDRILGERMKFF